MMVVTEAEVAVIAPSEQRGEFSAAVELRRLFPAITDTAQARTCARSIHVEPVRHVRLRVLPLYRVSIAWRGYRGRP